ncbi:MAG TPA: Mur ligase family protein [Anaerolineales bacterium]|nr:Mur ligase family protein [Anaerolineales bacterium]
MKKIYHFLRHRAAAIWLNHLHSQTVQIAVTGSYGKTSTTTAIFQALTAVHPAVRTDANLDTIYNVPITALQVRSGDRFAVFELGIDSRNEMDFHLRIVQPSISVVTGITPVHSDEKHAGSLEHIIQQKGRIIEVLRPQDTAILNADDRVVQAMAGRTRARILFYGSGPECDYRVADLETCLSGTAFNLHTPHGTLKIETGLLGGHNAANLAAAAAVAHLCGIPDDRIGAAFAGLHPLPGRFSVDRSANGLILINDTLRANPASTKAGLAFLGGLREPGRVIAVLGEMGELGVHAVNGHREVGIAAAAADPALLITVGELTHHTAEAARESGLPEDRIHAVRYVHAAAELLARETGPGDVVYLKGSLMRHLERIPMILAGEAVGCRVIACPFYHQCPDCDFLLTGYNHPKEI